MARARASAFDDMLMSERCYVMMRYSIVTRADDMIVDEERAVLR